MLKNYRPISLLPIFSKIFERVIYNSLFNHFVSNRLFKPSQSDFLPGDSCISQLLSIIHEIQTSFHSNLPVDVRGVFLDISKTFDKVSRKGLLYKLKSYWVEGELLSLWVTKTKGCFKWSKFRLEKNKFWCTPGVSIRFPFILDIYKRLTGRDYVNMSNLCWRYFTLFKNP